MTNVTPRQGFAWEVRLGIDSEQRCVGDDRRTGLLMLVPTWHFERRSDRAEHWSRDLNLVTSSAHVAEVEPGWWRGYKNLK